MTRKVLVLLSGGQDSATSLFWAKNNLIDQDGAPELHALSVYYGQRHQDELLAAREIAKLAGVVTHAEVRLDALFAGSTSALVDHSKPLEADGGMLDHHATKGLPTSFVPGRNLVFLGAAVGRAGAIGATAIVTGVCQTDYSGYPDCRHTFIDAMQQAITEAWPSGEATPVIYTPLMHKTKAQTVEMMAAYARSELPPSDTIRLAPTKAWRALAASITCYNGLRPGCGTCAACELRGKGFAEAGYPDPSQPLHYPPGMGEESRRLHREYNALVLAQRAGATNAGDVIRLTDECAAKRIILVPGGENL